MGRGLTRNERYRRTYNLLQREKRQLQAAGVPVEYKKLALFEPTANRTQDQTLRDSKFWVYWTHGNMSNGESVLTGVVKVDGKTYSGWGYKADGSYTQGLERIKELYGKPPAPRIEIPPLLV